MNYFIYDILFGYQIMTTKEESKSPIEEEDQSDEKVCNIPALSLLGQGSYSKVYKI